MLTTLAKLKALIGADNDLQDGWLETLRLAAEAVIKEYVGRDLESRTYTEFYSGTGNSYLALRQRPVTAVSSVYLDYGAAYGKEEGSFPASSLLVEGVDYVVDYDRVGYSRSGVLIRLRATWQEGARQYVPGKLSPEVRPQHGEIKVTYTAGYETIPDDVQAAVAMLVSSMRRNMPLGGNVVEERIGDYSYALAHGKYAFASYPDLGSLPQLLNRYKEVSF